MIRKPMLAESCKDINTLTFPVLASPKLDGIRGVFVDKQIVSRKFKPIPNVHVREVIENILGKYNHVFDGELMAPGEFNEVTSSIMTRSGEPDFVYNVFDCISPDKDIREPFHKRFAELTRLVKEINNPRINLVKHKLIMNVDELSEYEQECLMQGYEGVMVRSLSGPYKEGRSTVREGFLLKIKRFVDFEAEVIGFEEKMHNDNEATIDALGHTKRSSHQENMIPMDTLGAFLMRRLSDGVEFKCGCMNGVDEAGRKDIWNKRESYLGKTAKVKSQSVGELDRPRFPVFIGWRHEDDT